MVSVYARVNYIDPHRGTMPAMVMVRRGEGLVDLLATDGGDVIMHRQRVPYGEGSEGFWLYSWETPYACELPLLGTGRECRWIAVDHPDEDHAGDG